MPDSAPIPVGVKKGGRVRFVRTEGVAAQSLERRLFEYATVLSEPEVGLTLKVRFGEPPDDAIFWLRHSEIEAADAP